MKDFKAEYIRQTSGGEPEDRAVFRKYGSRQPVDGNSNLVDEYIYQDRDRNPYLKVEKYEPKAFLQWKWKDDQWVPGKPDGPKIPYYLPQLIEASPEEPVFVTEGEKDADNVGNLGGLVVTCASEGAGKWTEDLNPWFKGKKKVFVLQDNDDAGLRHALKVARNLAPIVPDVRIVPFADVPEGEDVSYWLAAGHTKDDLMGRCESAPRFLYEGNIGPQPAATAAPITPSPYVWVDPTTIPLRQWLYPPHYIRGFLSLTLAAGGTSKSTLTMTDAVAMATGKQLIGIKPRGLLRVWYFNLEDPMDELHRRMAAICKYHRITADDLGDRLLINSGRVDPLIIAEDERHGIARVRDAVVDRIRQQVQEHRIDVMIVDPFVASHMVAENDNSKINLVVRAWSGIAETANCAVHIVHHIRKTGREAATVDDGRGASALLAAARVARVINTMEEAEAERAGINPADRRFFFRADLGKANLTPPAEQADWYRRVSVDLENGGSAGVDFAAGDNVGVVDAYKYPRVDALKPLADDVWRIIAEVESENGPWRADSQAKTEPWVGVAVAKAMRLSIATKPERKRVAGLVNELILAGVLRVVTGQDAKRNQRDYVVVGPHAPRRTGEAG